MLSRENSFHRFSHGSGAFSLPSKRPSTDAQTASPPGKRPKPNQVLPTGSAPPQSTQPKAFHPSISPSGTPDRCVSPATSLGSSSRHRTPTTRYQTPLAGPIRNSSSHGSAQLPSAAQDFLLARSSSANPDLEQSAQPEVNQLPVNSGESTPARCLSPATVSEDSLAQTPNTATRAISPATPTSQRDPPDPESQAKGNQPGSAARSSSSPSRRQRQSPSSYCYRSPGRSFTTGLRLASIGGQPVQPVLHTQQAAVEKSHPESPRSQGLLPNTADRSEIRLQQPHTDQETLFVRSFPVDPLVTPPVADAATYKRYPSPVKAYAVSLDASATEKPGHSNGSLPPADMAPSSSRRRDLDADMLIEIPPNDVDTEPFPDNESVIDLVSDDQSSVDENDLEIGPVIYPNGSRLLPPEAMIEQDDQFDDDQVQQAPEKQVSEPTSKLGNVPSKASHAGWRDPSLPPLPKDELWDDDFWDFTRVDGWRMLVQPLKNVLETYGPATFWDEDSTYNPIYDLETAAMMGDHVVSYVALYLVHHANLGSSRQYAPVAVIPPTHVEGILRRKDALDKLKLLVWCRDRLPSEIFVPVIEGNHCYLWHGQVKGGQSGHFSLRLMLLDSLPNSHSSTFTRRAARVKNVIGLLFPELEDRITCQQQNIPNYQQQAGSLDCGYFVCQAISALAFQQASSLHFLRPVSEVRQGMRQILEMCKHGVLQRLTKGYRSKQVVSLHQNAPKPNFIPPWRQPTPVNINASSTPPPPLPLARSLLWRLPDKITPPPFRSPSNVPPAPKVGWDALAPLTLQSMRQESNSDERRRSNSGIRRITPLITPREFTPVRDHRYSAFFKELRSENCSWPEGMVRKNSGRNIQRLLEATFLEPNPSEAVGESAAGVTVVQHPWDSHGLEDTDGGYSLVELTHRLLQVQRPLLRAGALLTGTLDDKPLTLNWLTDSVDLQDEWLVGTLDVDSFSLTVEEAEFASPVLINAFPSRSTTLTRDNGIRIYHEGRFRPLSHFLNFTCFTGGFNNQMKINVFFPNYKVPRAANNQYVNMMSLKDYRIWFEDVVLPAIEEAYYHCPENLVQLLAQVKRDLPSDFEDATRRSKEPNGGRNFTGYKISHEALNIVLIYMRRIVNQTPHLAHLRGYFFHIYAKNLKSIGQVMPGEAGNDVLIRMFRTFPVVHWERQNPQDIVIDVGLEINVVEENLPDGIRELTLLWNQDKLRNLLKGQWQKPLVDAYCHSQVVAGLRSFPRQNRGHSVLKFQAYHKDMTVTRIHADNSTGTGFSPMDALWNAGRYTKQMKELSTAWSKYKSFGVRLEWRLAIWGADKLLQQNPDRWLRTLLDAETIVGHPTRDIVRFKEMCRSSYCRMITNQHALSPERQSNDSVHLLTATLSYLIKGLVKRPDDMSPSRSMAKKLKINLRAERYGIASIQPHMLATDNARIEGAVYPEEWTVLRYVRRKQPAGARLKTSHAPAGTQSGTAQSRPGQVGMDASTSTHTGTSDETPAGSGYWRPEDDQWAKRLVNETFARWLWLQFPDKLRREGAMAGAGGPLKFDRWDRMTTGTQYALRVRNARGFQEEIDVFFPDSWKVAHKKPSHWRSCQTSVLDVIRERIARQPEEAQNAYSGMLRRAIVRTLQTWQFLPSSNKNRIWAYKGNSASRQFMLYSNPSIRQG